MQRDTNRNEGFSLTRMINKKLEAAEKEPANYEVVLPELREKIASGIRSMPSRDVIDLVDGRLSYLLTVVDIPDGRHDLWMRALKEFVLEENEFGMYSFGIHATDIDGIMLFLMGIGHLGKRPISLSKKNFSLTSVLDEQLERAIKENGKLYDEVLYFVEDCLSDSINRMTTRENRQVKNEGLKYRIVLDLPKNHPSYFIQAVKDIVINENTEGTYGFTLEIEREARVLIVNITKSEQYQKTRLGYD